MAHLSCRPVGAFDRAVNKNPSLPPPRPDTVDPDLANAKNLQDFSYLKNKGKLNEPRREKTGLRGFRPGPTQTDLYSHRSGLEA